MVKKKLNPNQMFLLILIHLGLQPQIEEYFNTLKISREEIDDMIQRGYLINFNQDDEYMIDRFTVTEKFTEDLFMEDPHLKFYEFWDAYPAFITIDTRRIPARSTDKDALCDRYCQHITTVDQHICAMSALQWGIKRGMVCMGIEKFVASRQWEVLYQEMIKEKQHEQQFPHQRQV